MTNRQNRRAFHQAARGFQSSISGEWGEWQDHDVHSMTGFGVFPFKGLKRLTSNDRYSVQFFEKQIDWGLITHLVVRRHDRKPVRLWADMQRVKNELLGQERLAIEVFPPESQLIDAANCYHLWVLPEGFELPFGLHIPGWSE